jgi:hypothetical protein
LSVFKRLEPMESTMAIDPSLSVRAARDHYLAVNGFTMDDYDADMFEVDLGEVTGEVWRFPNSPARRPPTDSSGV